jgi:hypothetical protein
MPISDNKSSQETTQSRATKILAIGFLFSGFATSIDAAHDITNAVLIERSANCATFADEYTAKATDKQNAKTHAATIDITSNGETCTIISNAVPNHDFNETGRFAHAFREQDQNFTITANPVAATKPMPLTLRYDNAVFLNGVKLDLIAAGCYGVRDGKIGCRDMNTPYRYDPLGPGGGFGADEHNAHTQPDGTYHYHGNPLALFEQSNANAPSPVIGFAADGFPIFGSFIADGTTVRKAKSSYQMKSGTRPDGPKGTYDGTFIDDWQYVAGSGDLDACNGMVQDGVYGYVVTENYPHVMACFTGTPDASFQKRRR